MTTAYTIARLKQGTGAELNFQNKLELARFEAVTTGRAEGLFALADRAAEEIATTRLDHPAGDPSCIPTITPSLNEMIRVASAFADMKAMTEATRVWGAVEMLAPKGTDARNAAERWKETQQQSARL